MFSPKQAGTRDLHERLSYYTGVQTAAPDIHAAYSALAASDFASLYAVTTPYDDFAESFTHFVHSQLMNKPFRIESSDARRGLISGSASIKSRCAEKFALVEALLQ
jgi:hypothetical protein